MLGDAIRSEVWRLSKNPMVLFWSVVFLPVASTAMASFGNLFLKANSAKITVNGKAPPELAQMLMGGPVRVIEEVISGVSDFAAPPVLLFILIGAAVLYSGDYRWETWRLISARNSRTNLLLGKVAAMSLLALAAMLALLAGEIAQTLIKAAILERPLSWTTSPNAAGRFVGLFALSWAALIQFTMLALLAATITRSMLAAMFAPIVISAMLMFSPQALIGLGITPGEWISVLVNPGMAFDLLKTGVAGGTAAASLPEQGLLKASVSAVLWLLWPLLAALAWFKRQDLSKE